MCSTVQEQITTCGQNAIVKIGERTNIRPQKRARWHIFFIQSLDSSWKYLCKNMFFVVPVTFSNMFILNINVFLAFIRLT